MKQANSLLVLFLSIPFLALCQTNGKTAAEPLYASNTGKTYLVNSKTGDNVSKLEVDKVLFTLLEQDQKRKIKSIQDRLRTQTHVIKKTKDRKKKRSLLNSSRTLRSQKKELQTAIKVTQSKIKKIEILLANRKSNATELAEKKENVFNKSIPQNSDIEVLNETGFNVLPVHTGLIYKVQIGSYIGRIREDIFKGLTPVFYEPFKGGVRYSAGAFVKYDDAKQAKDYIAKTGLSDAFVVAYFNGKRIHMSEAKKHEALFAQPKE